MIWGEWNLLWIVLSYWNKWGNALRKKDNWINYWYVITLRKLYQINIWFYMLFLGTISGMITPSDYIVQHWSWDWLIWYDFHYHKPILTTFSVTPSGLLAKSSGYFWVLASLGASIAILFLYFSDTMVWWCLSNALSVYFQTSLQQHPSLPSHYLLSPSKFISWPFSHSAFSQQTW